MLFIPGSSNSTRRQSSSAKKEQKLCDALSWIALTFVREATGRDVAVCLNPTKPIELLVSDNLGSKQRPGDIEVVQSITSITTLALNASMKAQANYTPNTENVYNKAIDRMVGLNWDRIGRKMAKISSVLRHHQPSNGLQKFVEDRLELWVTSRQASGLATEMFTALKKESNASISATNGDQNVLLLKKSLSGLFDLSGQIASAAPNNREKTVKSLYKAFIQHCGYIENSDFLESSVHAEYLDEQSKYPFIKLQRRIRNLTKYNSGAFLFLKDGITYIRQFVGERDDLNKILTFTFIGDSLGVNISPQQIKWPNAPTIRNVPGASLWKASAQFAAHVHCEVAMVYYIVIRDLSLRVIGTSTLPCNACRDFIDAVSNQSTYYGWKLPPYSFKEEYDWLMIPTDPKTLVKAYFETVYNAVKERALNYIRAQQ